MEQSRYIHMYSTYAQGAGDRYLRSCAGSLLFTLLSRWGVSLNTELVEQLNESQVPEIMKEDASSDSPMCVFSFLKMLSFNTVESGDLNRIVMTWYASMHGM